MLRAEPLRPRRHGSSAVGGGNMLRFSSEANLDPQIRKPELLEQGQNLKADPIGKKKTCGKILRQTDFPNAVF